MRYYSSAAGAMALTADITAGATTLNVSSTAGLPVSFPYTLVLDVGQSTEEIVTVTAANGSLLTVSRGQDGSSAQSHSLGSVVRHMMTARDLREPQDHIAASSGVHGVTGPVASTTDAQTLTNKTLASPAITGTGTFTSPGTSTAPLTATSTGSFTRAPAFTVKGDGALQVTQAKSDAVISINPALVVKQGYSATGATYADVAQFYTSADGLIALIDKDGKFIAKGNPNSTDACLTLDPSGRAFYSDLLVAKNLSGTTVAAVDKDGNLTSPTITSLQTADTNLGNRVTAIETNLGSQTTFVASSAAKDGKRTHWGVFSGTTDASGYLTVTHGAGFTPTACVLTLGAGLAVQYAYDNLGATTFQVRLLNSAGSVLASTAASGSFFVGE